MEDALGTQIATSAVPGKGFNRGAPAAPGCPPSAAAGAARPAVSPCCHPSRLPTTHTHPAAGRPPPCRPPAVPSGAGQSGEVSWDEMGQLGLHKALVSEQGCLRLPAGCRLLPAAAPNAEPWAVWGKGLGRCLGLRKKGPLPAAVPTALALSACPSLRCRTNITRSGSFDSAETVYY